MSPWQTRSGTERPTHNGATYSANGIKPGLWQLDGTPGPITPNDPVQRHARLMFLGEEVLLPDRENSGNLRILAQPLKAGPRRAAFYAPAAEVETPFAVDPRTADVTHVSEVAVDSHIDLLTIAKHKNAHEEANQA